jgi:hypothetical protein
MKKLIILSAFILTGCSTAVPVTAKFPEVPEILTTKCPPLKQLKDDSKLSEISKTVVENYTSYYECAVIVEHWNEWYQIQKNIYEKAGK